jgi:hypothetical protein
MNYILHGIFDPWLRYVTNDGIWFDELGINKVAICLFAHHKSHENHLLGFFRWILVIAYFLSSAHES